MSTVYGNEAKTELDTNYPEYATLMTGETEKVCHTSCPAGRDTRNRFYVTSRGGAFLWHCHNCGNSGYYRPKDVFTNLLNTDQPIHSVLKSKHTLEELREIWDKAEDDIAHYSTDARLWLAEYQMLYTGTHRFVPQVNRVRLPIYGTARTLIGFQDRRLSTGEFGPKYITTYAEGYSGRGSFHRASTPVEPKRLFLVEDLLSAQKLALAGHDAYALCGTSVADFPLLVRIVSNYEIVVLWLDADVAGTTAAIKLYKELAAICTKQSVQVLKNHQPKEIDLDILKTI